MKCGVCFMTPKANPYADPAISGETLVGHNGPFFWVFISAWFMDEDWQLCLNSLERTEIADPEKRLLVTPAGTTPSGFLAQMPITEEREQREMEAEEELEQK